MNTPVQALVPLDGPVHTLGPLAKQMQRKEERKKKKDKNKKMLDYTSLQSVQCQHRQQCQHLPGAQEITESWTVGEIALARQLVTCLHVHTIHVYMATCTSADQHMQELYKTTVLIY
jgi:hypothetical protein